MRKMSFSFACSTLLSLAFLLGCSGTSPSNAGGGKAAPAPPSAPATPATAKAPPAETERSRALTRTARLLAGIGDPQDDGGDPVRASEAFKGHAAKFGRLWSAHQKERLSKISKWVDQELGAAGPQDAVFYPFSGPDYLYARTFFPRAKTYVLVGLEPVGYLPELDGSNPSALEAEFGSIRKSLTPILQISFFRTDDMAVDLKESGVLPILAVFLAGTGDRIVDVKKCSLSDDGTLKELEDQSSRAGAAAVEIQFVAEGDPQVRRLLYFSQDLSDQGLSRAPGFMAFAGKMDRPATFVKAASYLMHRETFSAVRSFILERSKMVVEDDTGIPIHFFGAPDWDMRYFGTYDKPIHKFRNREQPDLAAIYRDKGKVAPIDFGIGYGVRPGGCNLILATRRG